MKKTIALLLVILLMFNFIFLNSAYADDIPDPLYEASGAAPAADSDEDKSSLEQEAKPSRGVAGEIVEQGTVSQTQDGATKVTVGIGGFFASAVGTVSGLLARLFNVFFAIQIDVLLSYLTATDENGEIKDTLSIERMVFNRVALFNINFFDTDDYEVGNLKITANESNTKIKEGIAGTYYACRILALSISMVVLIYIGIRMAISTVASDQAKYKKMLVSWVESIILIFAMPYIMSVTFWFGEFITGIFYNIEQTMIGATQGGAASYDIFEDTIRASSANAVIFTSGLELTKWSIIYWFLLFIELKFLWTYMKRLLMVGFLIVISPLITITYSIDKVGDGKAQAFSIWMKEFIVNVLIQPLHALLYMVFVLTANYIATKSPLIALAMLFSLGQAERMVKVVFDMRGLVSLRGVDKFMKKEG